MKRLLQYIRTFSQSRICVIGDLTADIYIYGKPYRLSREAPVVVIRYDGEYLVPGGAANTVNNLLDLGAHVYPIGILGNDKPGTQLFCLLGAKCRYMDGVMLDPNYMTIMKTRILAGDDNTTKQQVLRVDRDHTQPISSDLQHHIVSYIEQIQNDVDAFIVSDYGYGLFTKRILACLKKVSRNKLLIVDSRYHMREFKGATIVTPNLAEAEYVTGITISDTQSLNRAGERLLKIVKSQAVLITMGNKGMTLFEHDKKPLHIPVVGNDTISDVTGAGDTVVALMALALSAGATFSEAARLANYAASIVVMKPGTATLTPEELIQAITADLKG
ncbi:MAG: bifunctional ADP-heptose synthase [Desulfobacterota bacterium]|nr:bifunctional ADP-heptose synthase [Thermodesulfobacteriota bacterium]